MLNIKNGEIELSPNQFKDEQTGLVYERVSLTLPKAVVDYYRMIAYAQKTDETILIEKNIVYNLNMEINGRSPDTWRELLNLKPAFKTLTSKL